MAANRMGQADEKVVSKRKRKRKRKPKLRPMPPVLRKLGDEAIERMHQRSATPDVAVTGGHHEWSYASPYDEGDDEDRWGALLFDAFATRSAAVFETFVDQLAKLCPNRWKDGEWKPDHETFIAAIQIVRSFEPRNEDGSMSRGPSGRGPPRHNEAW